MKFIPEAIPLEIGITIRPSSVIYRFTKLGDLTLSTEVSNVLSMIDEFQEF